MVAVICSLGKTKFPGFGCIFHSSYFKFGKANYERMGGERQLLWLVVGCFFFFFAKRQQDRENRTCVLTLFHKIFAFSGLTVSLPALVQDEVRLWARKGVWDLGKYSKSQKKKKKKPLSEPPPFTLTLSLAMTSVAFLVPAMADSVLQHPAVTNRLDLTQDSLFQQVLK